MPGDPNKLSQFWQELKRRKVLRVITVYAAVAFVILQLVEILAPSLRLPEWTMNLILVLLIVGFIIAVILSWIYDIHPEGGIVKTEPANKVKEEDVPQSSNSWKIASYISFVVIIALIVLNIIPRTGKKQILDKSIAVLPFINDSEDKGNEHIINGIMEEILINLQSIKELRVPGRTSVEQYRNNPKPIPEIASEMNVAYIVEGSGQRYGNKIRLRVQLVEGATDKHLWADLFDEEINGPEDVFRIQSQIAKSIAAELQAVITPEEEQLIEKVPTANLTAYDFYQRGREEHIDFWLDGGNRAALERAEDLYHKTLEYDSAFAQAYTGLAWVYLSRHRWESYFTEDFLDSMLILADIALSFDDQLADAYEIRGDYYKFNNKKEQAIIEYDKTIKLNPNYGWVYKQKGALYYYDDLVNVIDNFQRAASLERGPFLPGFYRDIGFAYTFAGFKEESYYYAKEALKLDDDSVAYYGAIARIEDVSGNYEEAIVSGLKGYAIDSLNPYILKYLGRDYLFNGLYEESLKYYEKYIERIKAQGQLLINEMPRIGYVYWKNGFKNKAEYIFDEQIKNSKKINELGRHYEYTKLTYYDLASAYAFRGERDKAYENLRIFNQRQMMPKWSIPLLNNDPMFESIRDEPEFQQIVRDVEAKYNAEHERVRQWLEENDML